jgi:CheY-like chemotaxis protein
MTLLQTYSTQAIPFLVVDDDDVDVMALERSVLKRDLPNPLYRARDGQEALDMLRAGVVHGKYIILLDLNMPRMGGLEFLRIIRADPALTSSVVFVLTTSKSDIDVAAAYREHIAGYIIKQRSDGSFLDIFELLEHYLRIVEVPASIRIPAL